MSFEFFKTPINIPTRLLCHYLNNAAMWIVPRNKVIFTTFDLHKLLKTSHKRICGDVRVVPVKISGLVWRSSGRDSGARTPPGAESRVITNFNYFFKPVAARWCFPAEAYANNRLALGINPTLSFFLRDKELTSKEVIKSEDIRGFLLIAASLTSVS